MPFSTRSDGTVIYLSAAGDTISQIAAAHYGTQIGTVEAILDANPGLAAQPYILPEGITITMPVKTTADQVKQIVNIWE